MNFHKTPPMSRSPVIGVNGPPHSGKGWLLDRLQEMLPHAVRLCVQDGILWSMQADGDAPPDITYAEYKAVIPNARQKMIDHATIKRAEDPNIFSRIITDSPIFQSGAPILFDNIGFMDEVYWFDFSASMLLVLRIDTPYSESEPIKSRHRRVPGRTWINDSRGPVEHRNMITAYDSQQMFLVLQWLSGRLTHEEAGPYHELKFIWDRCFQYHESTGDLFAELGATG